MLRPLLGARARRRACIALLSSLVVLPSPRTHAQEAPRVSLARALALADAQSPSLVVAHARLAQGEAARAAASPFFPENLELSGGAGPRLSGGTTGLDVQVGLQQRLEIFGEAFVRQDAAGRTEDKLRDALELERWQVHRDVHATFHQTLVARERASAAAELARFAEELVAIAKHRVLAGDVSKLSQTLAETELAQAKQSLILAEQDFAVEKLELARLCGVAGAGLEPEGALEAARAAPSIEALLAQARAQHRGVRMLRASVAEARALVVVAEREALPKPSLAATYEHEAASPGSSANDIVIATLSIPIPVWHRNQGGIARARADVSMAEAEARALDLQLEPRLRQGKMRVDSAARRIATYGGEILPSLAKNLELLRKAFELGEIDILQVSVARERFFTTRLALLDAYEAYFTSSADLELDVGADLWSDETHDIEPGAESIGGVR